MVFGYQVQLLLISLLLCIAATVNGNGNEKPRSGLKWISNSEVEKFTQEYWDKNLVRNSDEWITRNTYCRAEIDGCYYVGVVQLPSGRGGLCTVITKTSKTKEQSEFRDFQMLYNPGGAAKYTWRPWPEGTDNVNFPREAVKSDESCNLIVGRYNDGSVLEPALIDEDGYVYYLGGSWDLNDMYGGIRKKATWYWDNNEYDVLVEKTATKIELVDLEYGDPIKKIEKRFTGGSGTVSESVLRNELNIELTKTAELKIEYTNKKSWSHSIDIATSIGAELEISSPGKELTGGVAATLKFETKYSNTRGWNGETSHVQTFTQSVSAPLPPKTCAKVSLWMMQSIEDIPYKAKYRIHYNSGPPRNITDEGVLSNVVNFNGGSKTEPLKC